MFEVFDVYTEETIRVFDTKIAAWNYIHNEFSIVVGKDFDIRPIEPDHWTIVEDTWPEGENIIEIEKWQ